MEPQEDSRQRRRGAVDTANSIISTATRVRKGAQIAGLIGANIWIVVGIIVGITLVTFILTLSGGSAAGIPESGGEQTTTPTLPPTGGGGSPIIISGTGETCVSPYLGNKDCSVGNLLKYFSGDRSKAIVASLVCQSESGSYPLALNDTCSTNDYSIGLFQINAVAHCEGAYLSQSCHNPLSPAKRSACLASWQDPEQNIQQALRISNNGTSWTAWGTWKNAGKTRLGIKNLLTQCGISP